MSSLSFHRSENVKILPRCPLAGESQSSDLHAQQDQQSGKWTILPKCISSYTHNFSITLESTKLRGVLIDAVAFEIKGGLDLKKKQFVKCIYDVNI